MRVNQRGSEINGIVEVVSNSSDNEQISKRKHVKEGSSKDATDYKEKITKPKRREQPYRRQFALQKAIRKIKNPSPFHPSPPRVNVHRHGRNKTRNHCGFTAGIEWAAGKCRIRARAGQRDWWGRSVPA